MTERPIRIVAVRRKEVDLKRLARVAIELTRLQLEQPQPKQSVTPKVIPKAAPEKSP